MFEAVDPKVDFAATELDVLAFWERNQVANESMERPGTRGVYVFFEGPPTANGKPGIHHVSARAFKDIYPRYKTMQGFRVERRGGWDTHGLPVEVEIEKEIGSTGKRDIERFGIAEFNRRCRESAFRYIQDWNRLTERIAYWVDLKNAYITYQNSYMESCWWILKTFWDRSLLHEDYKVTMHCPRCNSTLADHEVSQGMRDEVDDPSVWPKFRVIAEDLVSRGLVPGLLSKNVYLLPWTTTPWTLPANTALAVRGDAMYVLVKAPERQGGSEMCFYIIAAERLEATFGTDPTNVVHTFPGADLRDLRYETLFDVPGVEGQRRVIVDDAVELTEGTGVLHVAPAYGDLEIGRRQGLSTVFSVDLEGKMVSGIALRAATSSQYDGRFFKDADELLVRDLIAANRLYRAERVTHAYPFCWRDDTPLLFYSKMSWYIRTTSVKDKLLTNNAAINWVPPHVGQGRFGRWLENNVDWAITRERYWGCPFPLWQTSDGSRRVFIGSVEQLASLAGPAVRDLDLHRPYIDDVTFTIDGQEYRRVLYTIDVWFESGAMPYAQWHYPFSGEEMLSGRFPADFICEAMDQTRGWFYSLHAIATLLTDKGDPATGRPPGALSKMYPESSAFRNCVVLGFVDDAQGRKMSKSRGNVVDPWSVIDIYGADALRWYFYSAGPPDLNKQFEATQIADVRRRFILTLWNSYSFFVLYARIDKPDLSRPMPVSELPEADRWLNARVQTLIRDITEMLERYDVTAATRAIERFVVDDVSLWYVRINRRRFWKSTNDRDKEAAYQTLYRALITVTYLIAPMMPFLSETLYQNLVRSSNKAAPLSVHLGSWPVVEASLTDERLLREMQVIMKLVELGRSARATANIRSRQVLSEMIVRVTSEDEIAAVERLRDTLLSELNVKKLTILGLGSDFVTYSVRPDPRKVGKRLGKLFPAFCDFLAMQDARAIVEHCRAGRKVTFDFEDTTVELEPDAFQVRVQGPPGFATVEDRGYLVALNTTLTDDLLDEGRIRELTRIVQNARKEAGFAITDRIKLGIVGGDKAKRALERFGRYVEDEALVDALALERLAETEYEIVTEVDGEVVTVTLRRASLTPP